MNDIAHISKLTLKMALFRYVSCTSEKKRGKEEENGTHIHTRPMNSNASFADAIAAARGRCHSHSASLLTDCLLYNSFCHFECNKFSYVYLHVVMQLIHIMRNIGFALNGSTYTPFYENGMGDGGECVSLFNTNNLQFNT